MKFQRGNVEHIVIHEDGIGYIVYDTPELNDVFMFVQSTNINKILKLTNVRIVEGLKGWY